jgi:hypothetical protein
VALVHSDREKGHLVPTQAIVGFDRPYSQNDIDNGRFDLYRGHPFISIIREQLDRNLASAIPCECNPAK